MKYEMPLDAIKFAYRKHCLHDDRIGWEELGNLLCDALCNIIGDDEFCTWTKQMRDEIERGHCEVNIEKEI